MKISNFEISILAKNYGFDEPCDNYYSYSKQLIQKNASEPNKTKQDVCCSTPYLHQLLDWLRDSRNITIKRISVMNKGWTYLVSEYVDQLGQIELDIDRKILYEYDDCLEYIIWKVLELKSNNKHLEYQRIPIQPHTFECIINDHCESINIYDICNSWRDLVLGQSSDDLKHSIMLSGLIQNMFHKNHLPRFHDYCASNDSEWFDEFDNNKEVIILEISQYYWDMIQNNTPFDANEIKNWCISTPTQKEILINDGWTYDWGTYSKEDQKLSKFIDIVKYINIMKN